jgi:hypothetical protein
MTAESREELLSAYLDGELSADERAQVEAWLAESAEYRQLYEELRAVRRDLELLPRHKLERDLGPTVLGRAEREVLSGNGRASTSQVQPRSAVGRWWSQGRSRRMYLWPAAAIAAALVIALFNLRPLGQRQVAREEGVEESSRVARERRFDASEPAAGPRGASSGAEFEQAPKTVPMFAKPSSKAAAESPAPGSAPSAERDRYGAVPAVDDLGAAKPADGAAPPAGMFNYSVKLDSNVKRALDNRAQVQLLQCDVSPEFIKENGLERVLVNNKLDFTRLNEVQANLQRNAIANQEAAPASQVEQWYAVEANPEQVKKIVTDLEQEQARKRVSNLAVGLPEQLDTLDAFGEAKSQSGPAKDDKAAGARAMKAQQAPEPAQAANGRPAAVENLSRQLSKDERTLPFPAEQRPILKFQKQPPLTIWVRAVDAAKPAAPPPAAPASPPSP